MKKLCILLLAAAALLLTPRSRQLEAGEFQKAPDSCRNAHAVLGWSNFVQGKEESSDDYERRRSAPWRHMGWVVGRMNWASICGKADPRVKVVGSPEAGAADQAAFKQYSVKGHDKALAYVVHCGSGGLCNRLAAGLHRNYKGIGKPKVHCGADALPNVLETGSAASMPFPDCEELNTTDGGGGDDDLDFDDDEDDKDEKDKKDKKKDKDDKKDDDEPSVDDF